MNEFYLVVHLYATIMYSSLLTHQLVSVDLYQPTLLQQEGGRCCEAVCYQLQSFPLTLHTISVLRAQCYKSHRQQNLVPNSSVTEDEYTWHMFNHPLLAHYMHM